MRQLTQARLVLLFIFSLLLIPVGVSADEKVFTNFGEYRVQHTVFNSSFIKPDIASAYNLTRGADYALVNIAVLRNSAGANSGGLPARVSGTVSNLMQQTRTLQFREIRDGDAVYYLADLRFQNEEVLHFNINVNVDGRDLEVTFSKKLYVE